MDGPAYFRALTKLKAITADRKWSTWSKGAPPPSGPPGAIALAPLLRLAAVDPPASAVLPLFSRGVRAHEAWARPAILEYPAV